MTAATIELTGGSGRSYSFHLYPWGQALPAGGGLYAAMKQEGPLVQAVYTANNTAIPCYSVQFIGHTDDLSQRPEHHHYEAVFAPAGVTHVAVIRHADEPTRRWIVADLIESLHPPLNRMAQG